MIPDMPLHHPPVRLTVRNPHLQTRLRTLYRSINIRQTALIDILEEEILAREAISDKSRTDIEYLTTLSLLTDLIVWGASIQIRNSAMFVSMPNYSQNADINDSVAIRGALRRLKSLRNSISQGEESPGVHKAPFPLTEESIIELVLVGDNAEYSAMFKSGISTWSMPYNTREGRTARFVLLGHHGSASDALGILEIGDDAPKNSHRDELLMSNGFDVNMARNDLLPRFRAFRLALRSEFAPNADLASEPTEFLAAISGLTQTDDTYTRKWLRYARLFAEAEIGCIEGDKAKILAGVSTIKDIVLPRVNIEMTICGAVPPYNSLMVGKLVAAMAAHPYVREFTKRPPGQILSRLFNPESLEPLLPGTGVLLVTTKGLYPGHSAQYNRVKVPANSNKQLSLKKLGSTSGTGTSSHISDRTAKYCKKFLELVGDAVSREYGSGGSKRSRTIHRAIVSLGLPATLSVAQVSRPVYGVQLCSNLTNVVLLNDIPQYLVDPNISPVEYCERVHKNWLQMPAVQLRMRTPEGWEVNVK